MAKSSEPEWNGAANVWRFDLKSFKDEPDEEVKFICKNNSAIDSYTLYTYHEDKDQWIVYGFVQIERTGRTYKLKKNSGIRDLDDYRYYGIVAQNGGTPNYSVKPDDDDLIVTIE